MAICHCFDSGKRVSSTKLQTDSKAFSEARAKTVSVYWGKRGDNGIKKGQELSKIK